jgi:hypothetical protein
MGISELGVMERRRIGHSRRHVYRYTSSTTHP